ncbi:hypothetical protein [Allostella humosa]|uniref:hypothetical protein n=1 Tax=Stella humosa TaxID=94 RepID=UPI0018D9FD1E
MRRRLIAHLVLIWVQREAVGDDLRAMQTDIKGAVVSQPGYADPLEAGVLAVDDLRLGDVGGLLFASGARPLLDVIVGHGAFLSLLGWISPADAPKEAVR